MQNDPVGRPKRQTRLPQRLADFQLEHTSLRRPDPTFLLMENNQEGKLSTTEGAAEMTPLTPPGDSPTSQIRWDATLDEWNHFYEDTSDLHSGPSQKSPEPEPQLAQSLQLEREPLETANSYKHVPSLPLSFRNQRRRTLSRIWIHSPQVLIQIRWSNPPHLTIQLQTW